MTVYNCIRYINRDTIKHNIWNIIEPKIYGYKDDIETYGIVKLLLNDLRKRLGAKGIELKITKEAIEFIIEKGYDINFGARPLKRTIQAEIETVVAKEMVAQNVVEGSVIQIVVNQEKDNLAIKNVKN